MAKEAEDILQKITDSDYEYGFESNISVDTIPKGLTEDTIRLISYKKEEPDWLLTRRL